MGLLLALLLLGLLVGLALALFFLGLALALFFLGLKRALCSVTDTFPPRILLRLGMAKNKVEPMYVYTLKTYK
jgi:hypothetical protein